MPPNLDPNGAGSAIEVGADLGYTYPLGLKLRPDSKLHSELLKKLMDRARDSKNTMERRHSKWQKIDQTLTAYIPDEDNDMWNQQLGRNKALDVVVPMSYATLDTLLANWVTVFTNGPLFQFRGMGPEDKVRAMLLELAIDSQTRRMKTLLNLHTQWRDAIAYGLGPVAVRWETKYERRIRRQPQGFFSRTLGLFQTTGYEREVTGRTPTYEANAIDNWDVYNYLIDPNVSCHEVQKAHFVGHIERTDYNTLLALERDEPGEYFNVRYLKDSDWKSGMRTTGGWTDKDRRGEWQVGSYNQVGDVHKMFVTLIPRDWGLGGLQYPEKWLFEVAGERIIIRAKPISLAHDMYPVAMCCPTYDGHTTAPVSTLEIVYPLQEALDWFYRSHVHNVRKTLHNMVIVDPFLVNYSDVINPEPGKVIRIRERAWGRGVKDVVEQLSTVDVTKNHVADMGATIDILQRVTGAVDTLQGIVRTGGERRSATEMRDTRLSALSRIQKQAMIAGVQSQQDLGYMFAKHLQQFMELPTYLELVGRHQRELQAIYGVEEIEADPLDFICEFDLVVGDGSTPGGEFLNEQIQMFQIAQSNPETFQAFDFVRMMLDIMRRAGNKAPTDMLKFHVLPDEQAGNVAADNNMQPASLSRGPTSIPSANPRQPSLEDVANA